MQNAFFVYWYLQKKLWVSWLSKITAQKAIAYFPPMKGLSTKIMIFRNIPVFTIELCKSTYVANSVSIRINIIDIIWMKFQTKLLNIPLHSQRTDSVKENIKILLPLDKPPFFPVFLSELD